MFDHSTTVIENQLHIESVSTRALLVTVGHPYLLLAQDKGLFTLGYRIDRRIPLHPCTFKCLRTRPFAYPQTFISPYYVDGEEDDAYM